MDIFEILILGVTQGITEFFPISSSGHLVLMQKIFQIHHSEVLLNISLHVGTLIAIIITLRKEIGLILKTLMNLSMIIEQYGSLTRAYIENDKVHLLVLLIIGSIPTALIGFLFKNFTNTIFGSVHLVGSMLLLSGTTLWLTKKITIPGKNILQTQIKDSLIIGILQGIAIIPGISRSGITISTGLLLGMSRESAGVYSFLLSIPAILGALALSLYSSNFQTSLNGESILLGITISTFIGYLTLKFMLQIIKSRRLHIFTPYCYMLGFLILTIA